MLKFKDGFDYLTAANLGMKWDSSTTGFTVVTGVYGKGKGVNPNGSNTLTKTLGVNLTTFFFSFHWFYSGVSARTVITFPDAGTAQVDLRVDGSGKLFFTRNGTTIGSVASTGLVAGTFYFLCGKITIDGTSGVAELKVNGSFVLNSGVTNLNTKNSSNAFSNQIQLKGNSGDIYDSFHIWDTAGGDNFSGYIVETIIDTTLATSAGSNTSWTPNASTNVSRINEANEDGDTSYNSSSTANQIDSFNFAALAESAGTILDMAINTIDRIDDATARTVSHYVKSSSATSLSSAFSPAAGYANHQSFFPTDPNTSASWTISGLNAAEKGYKEIS